MTAPKATSVILLALACVLSLLATHSLSFAQSEASLTTSGPSHAIAMYGEPMLNADYTHLSYVNPDAPQGGKIAYGVIGSFESVNPFILKSMRNTARGMWDPEYGHLYFQSLMTRSKDEPFTLYGLLAEKAEMPDDRSWIEFTLNKNAKWHDGKPVTPEDVIFTYELLTNKARPPFSTRTKRIQSIEKTGDLKVKFIFNKDSNREFPLIIAGFTPVLPKHAINPDTFDESSLTPILGSGPYKISSIDAGKHIKFEKDPNYWGKNLPVANGQFNFDEITIEYFRQQTTLFEAFKKGLVDVYSEGDPARWQRAYDFEAVTNGDIIKAEFTSEDPANMSGFVFNTRRTIFADPVVREALVTAFDFETLNKTLFFNAYTRTQSFWEGSELSSVGRPASALEKSILSGFPNAVAPTVMNGSWKLPETDGRGGDRKILRKAFKLLSEAGYKQKDGALYGPDGKAFSFEIMTRNLTEEKLALSFKTTLAKLGIAVEIRSVDDAQYQQRLNTFDYDMVVGAYNASLSPGIEQAWRWGSEAKDIEGSFNFAGVSNPAIDFLIKRIVEATEREEFVAVVRAMDRVLLSGNYIIPLYHLKGKWIAHRSYLDYPKKTALYGNQFPVWWHKEAK
ncbi:MAG: extracellular solute-binding protein [Salaquimonas sp.]